MQRLATTLAFAVFAALSLPAQADPIRFVADLSSANEVPGPVVSPGTGTASFELDQAAHTLLIDLVFSGLTANTTASHIHCCALPSANAAVAVTSPSLPGFPLGVTSGTYHMLVDLTLASSYRAGFIATEGGGTVAGAEAALTAGMLAGEAYINLHTTAFPGGEIRGNLVVPEPASLALLAAGALLLGAMRFRVRG